MRRLNKIVDVHIGITYKYVYLLYMPQSMCVCVCVCVWFKVKFSHSPRFVLFAWQTKTFLIFFRICFLSFCLCGTVCECMWECVCVSRAMLCIQIYAFSKRAFIYIRFQLWLLPASYRPSIVFVIETRISFKYVFVLYRSCFCFN